MTGTVIHRSNLHDGTFCGILPTVARPRLPRLCQANVTIILDSLQDRLEDVYREIERAAHAIRLISTGLIGQEPSSLIPSHHRRLLEYFRQCAYLLDAAATARTRLVS